MTVWKFSNLIYRFWEHSTRLKYYYSPLNLYPAFVFGKHCETKKHCDTKKTLWHKTTFIKLFLSELADADELDLVFDSVLAFSIKINFERWLIGGGASISDEASDESELSKIGFACLSVLFSTAFSAGFSDDFSLFFGGLPRFPPLPPDFDEIEVDLSVGCELTL